MSKAFWFSCRNIFFSRATFAHFSFLISKKKNADWTRLTSERWSTTPLESVPRTRLRKMLEKKINAHPLCWQTPRCIKNKSDEVPIILSTVGRVISSPYTRALATIWIGVCGYSSFVSCVMSLHFGCCQQVLEVFSFLEDHPSTPYLCLSVMSDLKAIMSN